MGVTGSQTPGEMLMGLVDRLYVINLPVRADRRRDFAGELRRIGLSFEDPRVVLYPAQRPDEPGGFGSVGAHGAFLSHLGVCEAALTAGARAFCVCEDDLDFHPRFAARIGPLASLLGAVPWDIVYAGHDGTVAGRALAGRPEVLELAPDRPVGQLHFVLFRAAAAVRLRDHLRAMLQGPRQGTPMPVDAAIAMFRAANPDLRTLAIAPPLGHQRPSRADIARLPLYDRLPVLRDMADVLRGLRRRLSA